MTDQLILGITVALVALLIAYEAVETWRWRGFDNRPPSRFGVIRFVRGAFGGLVSIVTLRRWRTRRAAPAPPTMHADDAAQQVGDPSSGPLHLQPGRIVVSGAPLASRQPIQPVRPTQQPRQGPSRIRLVRDTLGAALIMGGFVVVFANLMPVRPQGDVKGETATPRVVTVSPLAPSASPSSIDSATLDGATQTPTPALVSSTPSPTTGPVSVAKPTARPQPTDPPPPPPPAPPRPTPKPTKQPTPTPEPAPVVLSFGVNPDRALPLEQVTFTFTCQNCATYSINYGDTTGGSGDVTGGGASADHAYLLPGTYDCFLTLFNSEGGAVIAGPATVTVGVP